MPLDLQPKILRVLQEQEFERLGSVQKIHVDVRIVAATNQDLERLICERRFRADLFYRLNVIPVSLPPLRERFEDLPDLVRQFVSITAARMSKQIDTIPDTVMDALRSHDWPGNIRELHNVLERAVIMSPGPILTLPPFCAFLPMEYRLSRSTGRTLKDVERDRILEAVKEANGVIGGPNGAAVQLGLPRTTLLCRMSKLGIKHVRPE
jgi:formate hydrogenlyase transcriptional activator